MARAILRVFPGARLAFGPDDSQRLSITMSTSPGVSFPRTTFPADRGSRWPRFIKDAEPFERFSLPVPDARQFVEDLGQSYKVEHIDDELYKYGILSFYRQGEFVDLLPRPAHPPTPAKVRRVQAALDRRGLTGRATPTR